MCRLDCYPQMRVWKNMFEKLAETDRYSSAAKMTALESSQGIRCAARGGGVAGGTYPDAVRERAVQAVQEALSGASSAATFWRAATRSPRPWRSWGNCGSRCGATWQPQYCDTLSGLYGYLQSRLIQAHAETVGKHAAGGFAIDSDAAGRLDRRDAQSQLRRRPLAAGSRGHRRHAVARQRLASRILTRCDACGRRSLRIGAGSFSLSALAVWRSPSSRSPARRAPPWPAPTLARAISITSRPV